MICDCWKIGPNGWEEKKTKKGRVFTACKQHGNYVAGMPILDSQQKRKTFYNEFFGKSAGNGQYEPAFEGGEW